MPDSQTPQTPNGKAKRPTLRWKEDELDRIAAAARRVAEESHVPVTVPGYIKGAVEKRNDEVLGPES